MMIFFLVLMVKFVSRFMVETSSGVTAANRSLAGAPRSCWRALTSPCTPRSASSAYVDHVLVYVVAEVHQVIQEDVFDHERQGSRGAKDDVQAGVFAHIDDRGDLLEQVVDDEQVVHYVVAKATL